MATDLPLSTASYHWHCALFSFISKPASISVHPLPSPLQVLIRPSIQARPSTISLFSSIVMRHKGLGSENMHHTLTTSLAWKTRICIIISTLLSLISHNEDETERIHHTQTLGRAVKKHLQRNLCRTKVDLTSSTRIAHNIIGHK